MKAGDFAQLYDAHNSWWDDRRPEMRRLRNAYLMRYWQRSRDLDSTLLIETSRGYELIESYIASLFVKDPSVVIKPDLQNQGDPEISQDVANAWLLNTRSIIEDGLRLSLIYPFAAIKLSATTNPNVLFRVQASAVSPWDVIVDDTASSWESQRYCAHRYYLSLDQAKKRYGAKDYAERTFTRYIDYQDGGNTPTFRGVADNAATPNAERFIIVVEVYDLECDKFYVWSPDYKRDKWLYDGVKLDIGKEGDAAEKFDKIPFRTASDQPRIPLIPLYMSREPDAPLRGYSALRRVYDQIREVNTMRTFQAQAIRKAARQWMVRKGVLDPESMAKIAQGVDGEFIEVELSNGQELENTILPVPHSPMPPELQNYANIVDDDFARGSVMAPFTRGEATKATATEVQALAAYTASEIGRMARSRDSTISAMASTYLVMVATLLGEDTELVRLGGKAVTLVADDLTGDYAIFAQDSGDTPMSEAVKKQEFVSLIPVLQQVGVKPDKILKMLVRAFGLPEDFIEEGQVSQPAPPQAPVQEPAPLPDSAAVAGLNPGPARVSQVLPTGGVV
jgi:hypothetical protein